MSEHVDFSQLRARELSDLDKVRLGYLLLLEREIDEVGLSHWSDVIQAGRYSHKEFIDTILRSPEYLMHFKVPFHDMVHRARQAWIQTLPAFDSVLDIGGSSPNIETGAMIELGYAHRPRKIVIFDLPEEQQYWGKPKFPQGQDYSFSWGTVRYVHGQAERIDRVAELQERRFDLVFMGQVIEHLKPRALPSVLRWIAGHLSDRGRFIFDTPNRIVTRIQSPRKLIDEDHKYEYQPSELQEMLSANGLEVVSRWGLLDMPYSRQSGVFNDLEAYESELLTDRPDDGYLFAFETRARG